MTQITKHNSGLFLSVACAGLALSGCQVLGHQISDGLWFPVLIVVSFVVFVVWRVRSHGTRARSVDKTVASGWADGDASGHGGHTMMGDDHGGDDGGGHHG